MTSDDVLTTTAPVVGTPTRGGVPITDGFLWGASTAAHQVEGGNATSDWWGIEHRSGSPFPEPSGDAADSFHRWREDMDLLAGLGFRDYRFSIEWARIEPEAGRVSRAALAHYRRMVVGALERGLRPMVTLHHFTLPRWLADRGGWSAPDGPERFERYVRAAVDVVGRDVRHVCTINEPNMAAVIATFTAAPPDTEYGEPPVGLPLPDAATSVALIEAHGRARAVLREMAPGALVGWTVASQACEAQPGAEAVAARYRRPREDVFLEAARDDDWVGVQSYTRTRIGRDGPIGPPAGAELTLSGWEYYPAALGSAVRHTARVVGDVPIIVTENGIATADDHRRRAYTAAALEGLAEALADGVDVRGYLHWSALDNYEWGSFAPTYGLIAVDRHTFARTPRPSARWLADLGRGGVLPRREPGR